MYTSRVSENASITQRMAQLIMFLLMGFAIPCFASQDQDDGFSLLTEASSGVLTGSLQAARHFYKSESFEGEGSHHFIQIPKALPLRWNLGFTVSQLTAPATSQNSAIVDQNLSANWGLDWQIVPEFNSKVEMSADTIPVESYRHGNVSLRFEYLIPLRGRRGEPKFDPKFDPNDALSYYENERAKALARLDKEYRSAVEDRGGELEGGDSGTEEVGNGKEARQSSEDEEDDDENDEIYSDSDDEDSDPVAGRFPNLRLAYRFGINIHHISAKVFSRIPQLGSLAQNSDMSQFQNGPEIIYSPNAHLSLNAGVTFNSYAGTTVDGFLPLLEIGNVVRSIGTVGSSNLFLTFPQITTSGGVDWYINDSNSLSFNLNYTSYASVAQPDTFDGGPVYTGKLGTRWKLVMGADAFLSLGSSQLTPFSILGSLKIIYQL